MRAVDVIRQKRDGGPLSGDAITAFVRGVTDGSWPDYQVSALLMAIVWRGMSLPEATVLTGAMVPYKFGSSDGLFNLGSALAFVQSLPPGVYVAMNGRAYRWDHVRKNRERGIFEPL